jgi:hypothetical protein
MISKQRGVGGRTRVTPRLERRARTDTAPVETHLAKAQRVASRFVATHWPELRGVQPVATARHSHHPSPELLARLGLTRAELARLDAAGEYTFTFAGEHRHAEDGATPIVANVTVDAQLKIVKTSVSR